MAEVPIDPIDPGEPEVEDEVKVPPRSASRGTPDGDGSKEAVLLDLERERKARQRVERELKKFQEQNQTESEKAIAAAKAEGRTEALSTANARIVKAEIKSAASGVFANPELAVRLIDASQFEVDDDGNPDTKAIAAEVKRLVAAEPYLAAGAKPAPLPGGGATPSTGQSTDDWIRAQAGR